MARVSQPSPYARRSNRGRPFPPQAARAAGPSFPGSTARGDGGPARSNRGAHRPGEAPSHIRVTRQKRAREDGAPALHPPRPSAAGPGRPTSKPRRTGLQILSAFSPALNRSAGKTKSSRRLSRLTISLTCQRGESRPFFSFQGLKEEF